MGGEGEERERVYVVPGIRTRGRTTKPPAPWPSGPDGGLGRRPARHLAHHAALRSGGPRPPPPPLQQIPHELNKLSRLERLGKKGIDPDIEPALDLVLGAGADDGERQIPGPGICPQQGSRTEPTHPGHNDIKGDEIGPHLMDDFQTLGTIGRGHDLETLQLEIDPDQLADDLVVVHNKHPTRRPWHNSRVGRDRPPRPAFPHFRPPYEGPPPRPLTPRTPPKPFMNTPRELVVFYPSPRASAQRQTPP
jgi:hypothetical protein